MAICAMTVDQSGNDVVEVTSPGGTGGIVIVCAQASKQIPANFGNLGLDAAALASHIAGDPGAWCAARSARGEVACLRC
jgi:predicted N-formylglutamate amidohydrolase